ncbi:MAG TPA: hypothetical protein VHP33_18025 [Polyangiaceae bacterium]|nr:hypothetical protein [Polyangiaceae bacterium]
MTGAYDGHGASREVRLGPTQQDASSVDLDVLAASPVGFTPPRARGQDERDAGRPVRGELAQQLLSLRSGQKALSWPVSRLEAVRHHGADVARELAAPLGHLKHAADGGQLLLDRVARSAFGEPHVHEAIDLSRRDPRQRGVAAEHAHHVPRLRPIHVERALRTTLAFAVKDQSVECGGNRGLVRGCVGRIDGSAFPLTQRKLGRPPVGALG